jgi:toxin FitB
VKYLLDTCVLSELVRKRPSRMVVKWMRKQPDEDLAISVLTIGELHKGIVRLPESHRKSDLHHWVTNDLAARFDRRVLPISVVIAEKWGQLQGEAENAGRRLPVIDALLAATALVHRLSVVTRNTADFERSGAPIVNPWE